MHITKINHPSSCVEEYNDNIIFIICGLNLTHGKNLVNKSNRVIGTNQNFRHLLKMVSFNKVSILGSLPTRFKITFLALQSNSNNQCSVTRLKQEIGCCLSQNKCLLAPGFFPPPNNSGLDKTRQRINWLKGNQKCIPKILLAQLQVSYHAIVIHRRS